MLFTDSIGIIADDLTGANDTALQFHLKGCSTKILTDSVIPDFYVKTQVSALSTESRNTDTATAYRKTAEAAKCLTEKLKTEFLYKKIDSTLRGNIATEIKAILDVTDYEAALIMPAFPNEGRITVGGYHLLKGVPVERTEFARDPLAPIYESHIPTILKFELPENERDTVALIELNTVKQGAGPVLAKLKELLEDGKKLIVCDAVSSVDIEQVTLALKKCEKKLLCCGSAGAAQAFCNIVFPEAKYSHIPPNIPVMPKLVISGSATELAAIQIKRLETDEDIDDIYFIEISPEQILNFEKEEIVEKALRNLVKDKTVVIHTSSLFKNPDQMTVLLFDREISRDGFISMICDFLAEITEIILNQREAVLITIGGETSYKCFKRLNTKILQTVDAVAPAIPLCTDTNARFYVTKSGNLGTPSTMVDVIKYFGKDKL